MIPAIERWDFALEHGPERLRLEIEKHGIARARIDALLDEVMQSPWTFAERLFGQRPAMIERQVIRAIHGGRSFASGNMATPFHTDSQNYLGVPAHAHVMVCVRPAARGGANQYLDSWSLLARVERSDPELFQALFEVHRRMPFYSGDVYGPTVCVRRGDLVFTHSAQAPAADPVAQPLRPHIGAQPLMELSPEAGEAVVIDNHRILHGRNAFDDPDREFVRMLVWLRTPFASHPAYLARAASVGRNTERRLQRAADHTRRRFGLGDPRGADVGRHRLELVMEMLRGTAPGVLAARESVPEPELYRWRDAALGAAEAVLAAGALDGATEERELAHAIALLTGAAGAHRKSRP